MSAPEASAATPERSRPAWPTASDLVVAGLAWLATTAQITHGGVMGSEDPGLDGLAALLAAVGALPLLAARRWPVSVFTTTAAIAAGIAAFDYPIDMAVAPAAAIYHLTVQSRTRIRLHRRLDRVPTWSLVLLFFVVFLLVAGTVRAAVPGTEALHTGLLWLLLWFAGDRARLRHAQIQALHERAVRAEHEAERERLLAVAEERLRIARDLHDSVGHTTTLIAVRAGAARLHEDPQRSIASLLDIEGLARDTADQIDLLVTGLRDPADTQLGANPLPHGLAAIPELVERCRAAGLEAVLHSTGRPRNPGPAADQAAYRIVQESLTNAARHSRGPATIDIDYQAAGLRITITNPVDPTRPTDRSHAGHGIIGMRERATLLGGSLRAEPSSTSYRVQAWLPDPASPR